VACLASHGSAFVIANQVLSYHDRVRGLPPMVLERGVLMYLHQQVRPRAPMLLSQDILHLRIIHHSELNRSHGRKEAEGGACRLPPPCSIEDTRRDHFPIGISLSACQNHGLRTELVAQVTHTLCAMVASTLGGEFAAFP
jgi:hypothetical protein